MKVEEIATASISTQEEQEVSEEEKSKKTEELINEGMNLLTGAEGQESDPAKASLKFIEAGDLGNSEGYVSVSYSANGVAAVASNEVGRAIYK